MGYYRDRPNHTVLGKNVENLDFGLGKQLNVVSRGLMGHPMEDSSVEDNVDCGGPAQEVSGGKSISNWSRDHSYDILAKNVAAFYP